MGSVDLNQGSSVFRKWLIADGGWSAPTFPAPSTGKLRDTALVSGMLLPEAREEVRVSIHLSRGTVAAFIPLPHHAFENISSYFYSAVIL